ncbi:MAG TPA: hypothetical protein VFV97_15815 [Rhodanobacteraceae bacterium]|nr:hypothetical protein [Rhodanobacteraceae bacterium]
MRASDAGPGWTAAGLAFALLMLLLHAAAGLYSGGVSDSWRDLWWATRIAHGEAFPLAGPPIYGLFELGPWWFYLLALPARLFGTATAVVVFVQLLAGAKYLVAWRLGTRLVDARFGLAFAGALAVAGWSTIPLWFPSHTAVVETMLLLFAGATWRCWRELSIGNALLFGLAAGACVTAHPTTISYVVAAGMVLILHEPSPRAIARLALAASVVVLMLAPPWFDPAPHSYVRPVATYLGGDIAVAPLRRIPALLASAVVGGAWNGFLLMTRWSEATARTAWFIVCACLAVAAAGLLLLRRERDDLRIAAVAAGAAFIVQASFIALIRPITPMWMLSSLLPPLALLLGVGWYGGFTSERGVLRGVACIAFAVCVALSLVPFALFLRNVHSLRYAEGADAYGNTIEVSEGFAETPVPHFPVRRLDRLAPSLCEPAVLHARLAWVAEQSLETPLRLACGHWPELRFGGREGQGPHVAGLFTRAATASGIAPDRVVAGMAIYEHVVAIAPASGGRPTVLARDQIPPDRAPDVVVPFRVEFEARGADVAVLTNRFSSVLALKVRSATANGVAARVLDDDGGSTVYACAGCDAAASARWRFEFTGVEGDMDLVVLQAPSSR